MTGGRALTQHLRLYARDLVLNGVIGSVLVPRPLRWRALRLLGADVARSAICARVWIGSTRLAVGSGTFINYGCRLDNDAGLRIGAQCDIGPEVAFLTTTHDFGGADRRAGRVRHEAIRIGDGVWIGARATILPGVQVGDGAVIAAGAVVASDCEANSLYAGVPARRLRSLANPVPEADTNLSDETANSQTRLGPTVMEQLP